MKLAKMPSCAAGAIPCLRPTINCLAPWNGRSAAIWRPRKPLMAPDSLPLDTAASARGRPRRRPNERWRSRRDRYDHRQSFQDSTGDRQGGHGDGFFAGQLRPVRRHVALELIKRGMDLRTVLARSWSKRASLRLESRPGRTTVTATQRCTGAAWSATQTSPMPLRRASSGA
jgi:hypothetical protein